MKNRIISIIFIFLVLNRYSFCFSQNTQIDSLLTVLRTAKEDTLKVNVLNNLFLEYEFTDDGKAKEYLNKAFDLSHKINYKKGLAVTYTHLGFFADDKGNYPEALKNYFAALKIYTTINDKRGEADSYNNIGIINRTLGNYPESLKNHFAALKIREKIADKKGIAASYNNIGSIYQRQGNYEEALKNYFASLKLKEAIGNKKEIASTYLNIGTTYFSKGNYSEALKNYLACLEIKKAIGDKKGIAAAYSGIGNVYYTYGNYTEALKNYSACLEIYESINGKAGIIQSYINIGNVYTKQRKYKEAEKFLLKSKILSEKIGYKEYLQEAYSGLMFLDSARGNYKGAYENHKLYILYRDSLDNEETRKKTIQSQMTYDFEKKELATKAEQDKKDAVATADKKRQQIFFWFLAVLAIAIGFIAIIIFRGLQQSKKAKRVIELQRDEISEQKEVVELQKLLVEEHQKEIVDSITYAKRIQYTLLANKQLLDDNLNSNVNRSSDKGGVSEIEHSEVVLDTSAKGADTRTDSNYFVLFKPKDIVSGDFYWAAEKSWESTVNKEEKTKRFYIAACDSTGHGVPGAFMSLLNISFLNEAVNEKNIIEPHEILNHVRKRLIENMDGGQDGMDCILLCIENSSFENEFNSPLKRGAGGIRITYAAANNSPSLIKNGELISLKADKMPVGKGETGESFTLRTIEAEKGDSLYLYTDGYADQFGGPKGKKFKYKQLDELLVSISNLPAVKQSEILDQRFDDWKGNLEQVDDMLVLGIKM